MMNDELDPIDPPENPLHEEMMADAAREELENQGTREDHEELPDQPEESLTEEELKDEQQRIAMEIEGDLRMSQFDDDPNPYHGNYSEE